MGARVHWTRMVSHRGGGTMGLILLALAVCVPGAFAQAGAFEGRTIADIQFSPRQPLDAADLAKAMPLRKGQPLHAADVAASIDGLFGTGRFEDIAVDAELHGNAVVVRFQTRLAWFVGQVAVEGKVGSPPNKPQVRTATQLSLGAPFHDTEVATAVQSIESLLKANGLYRATVTPEVHRDDQAQQVFLTFRLDEKKRAKYEMPVIPPATDLADSTLLRATGWRIPLIHWWRQVTEARTNGGPQGILKKYARQDRLTAEADVKDLNYDAARNRVQPVLAITPGPKVKVTAAEAKVKKSVLKRYVPVFQESAVYTDLLVQGKRNLEDYFQSQGYYDVDVEYRRSGPQNDLETIEYSIAKGTRYKLVRLTILGNDYFPKSDITDRMFMHAAAFNLRHGRYSEAFQKKDEQNIADLYQSNGFRDVKVTTTVDRNYQGKAGQVAVTVRIDPGTQWLVESLTIRGVDDAARKEMAPQLASVAGQPFAEADLARDRNYLINYYAQRGYPAATVEADWHAAAQPRRANVVYTIAPGSRQYVREVLLNGLDTTRRSLVERTIRIDAGDPFSPVDQLNAQQRLYNLGVFARVDTAIEDSDGDEDHKYVIYSFDEADRYQATLGVGAIVADFGTPSTSSLSAPGGTTGFSPEVSLDVSRLNFLGLGHTITLKGAYSSLEKRGSLSYLQPRLHNIQGLDLTYSLLYDNTLNVRTFASRREEGSVQLSDKFSKSLTGLLRFAYRRIGVSDVIIPVLLVPQFLQPVRIGMLSVNFNQDRRDNPANATRGMWNTVDMGVAGSFFGSQRSFARVLLRNATYYKLGQHVVLARQTQLGIIEPFSVPQGVSEQEAVPLPERFFGGGADSLRAFGYNEAGPRDVGAPLSPGGPASQPTGFPLGGNALFSNNVELRFPLLGQNIQGVLFEDMGNVYTSLSNISFRYHQRNLQDFDYAAQAPGIGIRYKTPVGPLRVDLAYALNPPSFYGFGGTPAQLLQCNPNVPASSLPGYCQSTRQTLSHVQFFFSIGQTF
ncbi:MAG TPA: BamA/TamA family outer membrane protein [Verrucomicrobiae bacterium]|nr:BamA/TamA family outer membrane protein [Verrucomicrobiae bacterium]